MHKNVQTNPEKSQKNHTTLLLFYVDTRKKLKAIRGNGYRFVPKGGTFPTENLHACCDKLQFVRSIYPNLPQMGQNLYHGMLMTLHNSMRGFLNFRRVLDLLEFKNQACTQGHRFDFQPIYMHQSMCMQFKFELCT